MREPEVPSGRIPQVAVVGSGPSGCYVAQFLTKTDPRVHVTVFDRLPVPYGLVRYGVAADHQGTKAITRQFERVFDSPRVRFAGNITLGHQVTVEDLRANFDAVVLATGLHEDRALAIPGAGRAGVVGAGRVTRYLNGHPDENGDDLEFGGDVVVIGAGNVAIDVVRLLAKASEHYDGSDLDDEAHGLLASQIASITLLARSSAADAKFDRAMLRELGDIAGVVIEAHGLSPDEGDQKSATVRALAAADAVPSRVRITLRFRTATVEIIGKERVEGVRVRDASGEHLVPAQTIVTAIGFTGEAAAPPVARVHTVGWARRGPVGTIPENRADAKQVASDVLTTLDVPDEAPSRPGFDGLPQVVRDRAVGFEHWRQIDAYELASAAPRRTRRKVRTWAGLLGQRMEHELTTPAGRTDDEGTD
ncbi:FAD-dependent oxidoreductase [Microbacterium lacus]|uniref:FAD-dependent oxidoreductase n=1 Tax=Microbacterium lacus TaxID=415217 RepID=UPI0012FDCBC7|nr:FAD-dependent oxidoreductase [Microbacterium lacus]